MAVTKEWTVEDVGSLVADLKLFRSPSEIACTLGRDEEDVRERMAELGLSEQTQVSTSN